MTESILVSVDVGFREVKARWTKQDSYCVFPSVIAPARASDFQAGLNGFNQNHIRYKGHDFFVADHALTHSPLAGQTVNRSRTRSLEYPTLFMAALAQMIPGHKVVRLITGLPNSEMKDEVQVRAALLGQHDIVYNGRKYSYEIDQVRVVPQALGILVREGFKLVPGKLDIDDHSLINEPNLFIDIGGRTVNLMYMQGVEYISELSDSQSLGMYRVLEDVRKALNQMYDLQLSLAEIDGIFKNRSQNGGYSVKIQGVHKTISKVVEPILDQVAESIKREATTLWRDTNASSLILAGGGSHHLGQKVADKIGHPRTKIVDRPEFAVAGGMYLYGIFLDQRNAWERK